ncbi:6355_t:CDS:2 [Funneliformis geosporum]|uniref:18072_t:CDS:1 n=1 Tax=Funneliformis geosporum TaxID=1117311 RepID=A0A9W4SE65_9GLOM|nr:18072_t:CDS:2 [Funneliformis geosporum]CAI2166543.1 6355_t:CDS:2 [Funneliformis geosporum]
MTNTRMETDAQKMTDNLMTRFEVSNSVELQNKMVQTFKCFSEIQQFKAVGNEFMEKKLIIISEERSKFRDFAEQSIKHSLVMRNHSSDLITFAECCEDESVNDFELLELLRSSLECSKLNKEKTISLKEQLEGIGTRLGLVSNEILIHNENLMEEQENLSKKISEADKVTDNAMSVSKSSAMAAGVGIVAAVAAAPFTGGASLAVPVAEAIVWIGMTTILGSAVAATVSTTVAGVSSIRSTFLNSNYHLKNTLPEMKKNLDNIIEMISRYESYWESQITEIDDIIEKMERYKNGRQMVKTISRAISDKAKAIHKDSNDYSVCLRKAVNADKTGMIL